MIYYTANFLVVYLKSEIFLGYALIFFLRQWLWIKYVMAQFSITISCWHGCYIELLYIQIINQRKNLLLYKITWAFYPLSFN